MKVFSETDSLVIKLEGWEKVWSLKSRIEIPKDVVAGVDHIAESPVKNIALPFVKFPGTAIPRVLFAGSFIKPGERDFWYLRVHHPGVLDIKTKPGSFTYDRILISCDEASAQTALSWWNDKR